MANKHHVSEHSQPCAKLIVPVLGKNIDKTDERQLLARLQQIRDGRLMLERQERLVRFYLDRVDKAKKAKEAIKRLP